MPAAPAVLSTAKLSPPPYGRGRTKTDDSFIEIHGGPFPVRKNGHAILSVLSLESG